MENNYTHSTHTSPKGPRNVEWVPVILLSKYHEYSGILAKAVIGVPKRHNDVRKKLTVPVNTRM